ncbi:MAG: hypothetical protein ONB49_00490 [candidate division KSB1 bacterium]|nr:hypothetical protein [candidate division KSB1 bacterium]
MIRRRLGSIPSSAEAVQNQRDKFVGVQPTLHQLFELFLTGPHEVE